MATLETLESKVDALTAAVAEMRGEMKGKLHEAPCSAQLAGIIELQEKHIRPLEDSRERVRGVLWAIAALALLGSILGAIETMQRLWRE